MVNSCKEAPRACECECLVNLPSSRIRRPIPYAIEAIEARRTVVTVRAQIDPLTPCLVPRLTLMKVFLLLVCSVYKQVLLI